MNNISQISIFDYREIENLGDLERLKIFFENIQDNKLCQTMDLEPMSYVMQNMDYQ